MRDVVIVSTARTAIGKSQRGSLRNTRPDDLAAVAIRAAVERATGLDPAQIDDVVMGCAQPELEQGLSIARLGALRAGLPSSIPGLTVNRFCASGLEAIAIAAQSIACGTAEIVVAGGAESMTMVPFMGSTTRPNPWLMEHLPDTYLGMGLSVEQLAKRYGVTREASDVFSVESHRKALEAQAAGRFDAEIVPVTVIEETIEGVEPVQREVAFNRDEGPRAGTTMEVLGGLRLAFGEDGVITAGNASQRSDGAAAVVLMTAEMAAKLGLTPRLRFVAYAVAAVEPQDFGIGPAYAVPKLLKHVKLHPEDIDVIEFNEAFAAQVLCSMQKFPLPMERVNVNGGAVALGHPLGCTGARQTVTVEAEMRRRGSRYGMVTMCAALGMGAAGLFERV